MLNAIPNKFFERLKKLTFCVVLCLSLQTPAYAAPNQLNPQQTAAVMAVINMLLLDEEGERTESLSIGGLENAVVTTNSPFTGTFGRQSGTIDFCFIVSSQQINSLALSINGVPQVGSNKPKVGENCYSIPASQQRNQNTVSFTIDGGVASFRLLGIERANQSRLGIPVLPRKDWGVREVRKVLKIFAFGGHATDRQIAEWADMPANMAIAEMLTFDQHNAKLSPLSPNERYTEPAERHGTLTGFYNYIGSTSSNIPIQVDQRQYLGPEGYRFDDTFGRMVAMRGLNPFRQRIGFWETNYHLAVNLETSVDRQHLLVYYDAIMDAHERRLPYHQVIGVAAKSAAIALQYGHRRNRCSNYGYYNNQCYIRNPGTCEFEGNADFGRELHQLFYGIFGEGDPNHENVTIENTARMLTGMYVGYREGFGLATEVDFNTCGHYQDSFGVLRILGRNITGVDAAAKIDNLMPISIQHPESLRNLPVYIISTLADDSMTEPKRQLLRRAWAQLGANKDFLTFIRTYATSRMFHAPDHVKYLTSFERAYYVANKFQLDNIEAFLSGDSANDGGRAGMDTEDVMVGDNAGRVFRPLHNVFGGQNSTEASNSALAFEKNYNRSATEANWQFNIGYTADCDGCDQGQAWLKDWRKVIPRRNGGYRAGDVASWLWNHVVGNMDNYTELERAQLLAILGAKRLPREDGTVPPWYENNRHTFFDLNYLMCMRADRIDQGETRNNLANLMSYQSWDRNCRPNNGGYSPAEIAAFNFSFNGDQLRNSNSQPFPYLRGLIQELASQNVDLDSSDPIARVRANERIHAALAFIFATPFVFADGQ